MMRQGGFRDNYLLLIHRKFCIMKEGVIFIEKDFWKRMETDRERYVFVDKIINSHSDIYTDYQKKDIGNDAILSDVYFETGGRLYWNKDFCDYFDSNDIVALSSIYFLDKDSLFCEEKSDSRGIIVRNNNQYADDNLFDLHQQDIDESQRYEKGWKNNVFKPILSNKQCNALIINDKYLCNKGYIDSALKDILDLLLPYKTDLPFHLSVFSEINSNGDSIFENIKGIVSSVRSQDFLNNTEVTLCYSTLHDRFIISNTFLITVGAGLALFQNKGKPKNSTAIKLIYPTAIGEKTEYNLFIKKTKEINDGTKNYWGKRVNRLFDLV